MAEESGVVDASALYESYKAGVDAELRTNFGKEWFGVITGFTLPGSRGSLCRTMDSEASAAYKEGRYEEAADRFIHWLAVHDTDPSTTLVSEMRATLTSNIGACLGQLGQLDDAAVWYEKALQEFKALPFSVWRDVAISRVFYGRLVDQRVKYVEERLVDLRLGKAPPADTYQDGYGVNRKFSAAEMEGKPVIYWTDPYSWYKYASHKISEATAYRRMPEGSRVDAPTAGAPAAEAMI